MEKTITSFIIAILISCSFAEEEKDVFGVLKTVSYSAKRIEMEISIQNNSDSTIYLDSNLVPYVFQIMNSMDDGLSVKFISGEERGKDRWIFIVKSKSVKIQPSQNHRFIISKKHNFGPLEGTARVQVKFNYYIKDGRSGRSIAVSKDIVFAKDER